MPQSQGVSVAACATGNRNDTGVDPFSTIKEPECLAKWQLIRLDMLLASYQSMLKSYGRLAPLQDKIFKYVQREISEMEESESWRLDSDEQDHDPEEPNDAWPV